MINTLFTIVVLIGLVLVYTLLNKFFFKKKKFEVANDSMRFLALFFDLMIFNIIVLGGGFLYFLIRGEVKSHVLGYIDVIVNKTGYGKLRYDWFLLELKIMLGYFVYAVIMESISTKGTFGKQFVKIKLDTQMTFFKSVIRNVVKLLSIALFPVMIMFSRRSEDRKWLHDRISGTRIIKK